MGGPVFLKQNTEVSASPFKETAEFLKSLLYSSKNSKDEKSAFDYCVNSLKARISYLAGKSSKETASDVFKCQAALHLTAYILERIYQSDKIVSKKAALNFTLDSKAKQFEMWSNEKVSPSTSSLSQSFINDYLSTLRSKMPTPYNVLNCVTYPRAALRELFPKYAKRKMSSTELSLFLNGGTALASAEKNGYTARLLSSFELGNSPDFTSGKLVLRVQGAKSKTEISTWCSKGDYPIYLDKNGNCRAVSESEATRLFSTGRVYLTHHFLTAVNENGKKNVIHSTSVNNQGAVEQPLSEYMQSSRNRSSQYIMVDLRKVFPALAK